MRVVSIDIETTGLDPKTHRVLEVGAVIFDTNNCDFGQRVRGNWLLEFPDQETLPISPYCAKLHTKSGLWDRFLSKDKCIVPAKDFAMEFVKWLRINNLTGPYTAAGKNFGSFDLQFLKQLPEFDHYVKLRHRCFDPSVLFMRPDDEVFPSLDTCCERAGIDKQTDHTAVGDALLVAELTYRGLNQRLVDRAARENAIGEAIGEASMCWEPRPTGVFASSQASDVAKRLIEKLG